MANKKCMVFETLGNVQNLQVCEASQASDGLIRLSGIFGVCGVKNGNNRIYDKANYATMVEALQQTIVTEGCPGELEHPNTMNVDLNKVSHKIESIEMNEDGTITGTIALLNTSKGKEAQAIVEGGLPLYISSRGAGSIDESGHVTLTTIKTYDLVGTPGFSQAKLQLKKGQKFESLNESLEDGNIVYAIVEGDDLLGDGDEGDNKDGGNSDAAPKDPEPKNDDNKDSKEGDKGDTNDGDKSGDDNNQNDDNNKNSHDTTMNELKEAIDKLTEKVTNLEAELHVAQESLAAKDNELAKLNEAMNGVNDKIETVDGKVANMNPNYAAVEQWVKEEFAPEFKNEISESVLEQSQKWVCEEFAPAVQGWVTEEFAPEVQGWVCEEFAPEVQGWVTEEFAPEVQNWVCEEFAPEVQGWVCEEFAPTVEAWINEEYTPETTQNISEAIEAKVNENINNNMNSFMENQKAEKLGNIDALLESMSTGKDAVVELLKEQQASDKYAGVFVVERMPAQYQPTWNALSEAKKDEIIRQSKAYDFTKQGVLESFWSSVDFTEQQVNEHKEEAVVANHQNSIAAQMMRLRNAHLQN